MASHPHHERHDRRHDARGGSLIQRLRAALRDRDGEGGDGREATCARLNLLVDRMAEVAVEANRRMPEVREHDPLRFAVTDLLPNRVRLACAFLADVSEPEAEHLDAFLDGVETSVRAQASAADGADAIMQAAEDLHSYLLGHDIVEPVYRHVSAGSLFRRGEAAAPAEALDAWHAFLESPAHGARAASATPTACDSHQYALAA
jgi:hypothetical protein